MQGKPNFKKLSRGRRRAVEPAGHSLVTMEPLFAGGGLPLLARPTVDGVDLIAWAGERRQQLGETLTRHGGILFRGFDLSAADRFERLIAAVSGEALEYRERSSPRNQVAGKVYTSTEYPADQEIFLHNENSYQHKWPKKIFFFCVTAAESGGETPIADCRQVLAELDPTLVQRFAEKGVMYLRNFGDAIGLSWRNVFQTDDRTEVEAYCRTAGIDFEWQPAGGLRTRSRRNATAVHPETGERLWFNHATFFHVSTLPVAVREGLVSQLAPQELPSNSFYGDGSEIEDEVLEQLRAAYRAATVKFPWQPGDLLMLDNMLVAHGRTSFVGPRRVLVGMAEPMSAATPSPAAG